MSVKPSGIKKNDKNFARDVSKAKMKYRKKRAYIIILVCSFLLLITLTKSFMYSRQKADLQEHISNQEQRIKDLELTNKKNELIISKLKDPYFIMDFARDAYGLGYEGEIIFNLPNKENYLAEYSKSIITDDIDQQIANIDKSKLVDDDKILGKKDDKENKKDKKDDKENKKDKKTKEKESN